MSKKMSHFAPTDITGIAAWLRQRAEGHAPDFDIAVYATPEIWSAIADQLALPQAADDTDDRMVKISKLIGDLQSIKDRFGDTCVYIRRGGLSWGAVALNRCDDDKKHGVFELQAQHDRDMLQRLEQIERLKESRNRAETEANRLRAALADPRNDRVTSQPDSDQCDCENPEPETGVALVSEDCPIHGGRS